MRRILVVLTVALIFAGCKKKEAPAPAAPAAAATSTVLEVGKPMPAYSAQWLDGSKFDLAAERGNVVLLNLWATWCGPCRFEIPELQRMHDRLASRKFKVIGVSVDEGSPDEVKKFVAEQKMTYPVALDPEGRLASVFETTVLPTSALIDRSGKVVWKSAGIVLPTDEKMNAAIEKALAE